MSDGACARYQVNCAAMSAPLNLDDTGILLNANDCAAMSAAFRHKQVLEVVVAPVLVMSRKMK